MAAERFYESSQWLPAGATNGLTGLAARNAVGYYWKNFGMNPDYQRVMREAPH
jgi:hypothetical protein